MTTAFVLSGGGNLGPLQAGAVLALMESGIQPDLFVGSSVGALNAAFLATRPGATGARALVAASSSMQRREAFRFNPVAVLAGFVGLRNYLVSDHHLRALIRRWIQVDLIERAATPLAVTATDALSGEIVLLRSGDIVDALAASSAIPGIFPPVQIAGRWLIDGSISADRPVLQAQELGADTIYMIDATTAPRVRPPRGAIAVAMNSVSLVTSQASRDQLTTALEHADATGGHVYVVPSAQQPAPSPFNFRMSATLAEAAYARTVAWLDSNEELRPDVTNLGKSTIEPEYPGAR